MKVLKIILISSVLMNASMAFSKTTGGGDTVHVVARGSGAAASGSSGAGGAASVSSPAENYHDVAIPDVREADENLRKESITAALRSTRIDTSADVPRPLTEVFMSSGEKSDIRLSVSSGAFIDKEGKLFYDKKRQPKKGATALSFARISMKDVGEPYLVKKVPTYSKPIEGVDYLNNKMFTNRELCVKTTRDAVTSGKPERCIGLMNDLLVEIDEAFAMLSNHSKIHEVFYKYQVIANTCERVFEKNDCGMKNFGKPVYQRIQLLNKNFQSLIWAYNAFLKISRDEEMTREFLERNGSDNSAGAASGAGR